MGGRTANRSVVPYEMFFFSQICGWMAGGHGGDKRGLSVVMQTDLITFVPPGTSSISLILHLQCPRNLPNGSKKFIQINHIKETSKTDNSF